MRGSVRPSMRSAATKSKDWFRIENLHKDDAQSTDSKAVIYIYDEIGDSWWGESTSASDFIKQVAGLGVDEIELHINSPGGDIFDGVAIYTALKAHPATVTVYVDALAASAASFIAQAGDEIIMTEAATMMIHDGSAMAWGTAADMRDTADVLDKLSNTVARIYAGRAGNTEKYWRDHMIEEIWLDANEAVEMGLADKVGGDTEKKDLAAKNKWDFSIFNYSGRESAPNPLEIRTRITNRLIEETKMEEDEQTGQDQNPGTGSPDTDPDAQTTGEPAEAPGGAGAGNEGTEPGGQADADPDEQTGSPSTPPESTPPPDPNPQNSAQTFAFMVGGQSVNMTMAQAQARINELTAFRNESIVAGKKSFIKQLHDEKKITGPQVASLEAFVMSLPDEQYDAWKATWEGASGVPMLHSQVGGATNQTGDTPAAEQATADEIETCEAIVRNFARSNMPRATIEQTPSYQRLMQLKPDFKL